VEGVTVAREVVEAAGDLNLIRPEPRLRPERAPGPTLAVEAVADRDPERVARNFQTKLPTVTCGLTRHPAKPSCTAGATI
jgi:hypothetical protein